MSRLPTTSLPAGAWTGACQLRARFVGETGYGLAYGSHVDGTGRADSDLDLLFVGVGLSSHRLAELTADVIALHRQYGLRLDTEVAYENKLHATRTMVRMALAFVAFPVTRDAVEVPRLLVDPASLNSSAFRHRLILGALSGPHMFAGGNIRLYRQHRDAADRCVGLLAASLLRDHEVFSTDEAAEALTTGAYGETDKDYLGYRTGPHLYAVLSRGLADLAGAGALIGVDGTRWRQRPAVRGRLLDRVARFVGRPGGLKQCGSVREE